MSSPSPLPGPGKARRRLAATLLVSAWALCATAALAGFAVLGRYSSTPGSQADAPPRWPQASSLELDGERFTLLVFAHPRCPCTRATLEELDRLVARCAGRLRPSVVFQVPAGLDLEWARGDLWQKASAMAQVEVRADPEGLEARRFGARTSGQALLYDPRGELLFAGGLTNARGHQGASEGADDVASLSRGGEAACCETPVFGCSLFGADE